MANITHELRTPLTGIIGFAELLSAGDDGDLTTSQSEDVEQIESSSRTLLKVIDGILELSRIDAGMIEVTTTQVDVVSAIRSVVNSLESVARAKNLSLSVDVEQPANWVVGDGAMVREILTTLVANAIKFTSKGEIAVRCRTLGERTEVSVEDTGIGLSKEAAKYVFDGFRQADGSVTRKFGGAGLGLAIARKLVELQGGQIGVESVEGRSSRFWFTLPTASEPGRIEEPVPQESAVS